MTHPKNLSIKDFLYHLPEEKIAFRPLAERDASKILIYDDGNIRQSTYQNISSFIPQKSLLVFNNTKVVAARLRFTKPTGGAIEIFCLEPHESYADVASAMKETARVQWLCLVGGAAKWKNGQVLAHTLQLQGRQIILQANFIEKRTDCFAIEISWNDDTMSFAEILHHAGNIPLPPYIKREAEIDDAQRYQTVYAKHDGSVAAPTAGLHFTTNVMAALHAKNIGTDFVTLHVGAGTFKPVKADVMEEHEMHAEFIEVQTSFIKRLISNLQNPIVAVGTTSLRTLETLYWLGCKLLQDANIFSNQMPFISQWEVYNITTEYSAGEALAALLEYANHTNHKKIMAKTQIIIAPGYRVRIVTGLVTNFHQPASTLLLLVAAFIGDDWRKVYNYALENDFRFLSYGDGSLLWKR